MITQHKFQEFTEKAIKKINKCFYPECEIESINSHILQKNGVLKPLIIDNHLYEMRTNFHYKSPHTIERIGYNKAFSFNCFCFTHDNNLFKAIEKETIDFTIYKNRLLFTLRTIYNEKFRKMVRLDVNQTCIKYISDSSEFEENPALYLKQLGILQSEEEQYKISLDEINNIITEILNDLNTHNESFIIEYKLIKQKELCLSSFYPYETSLEISHKPEDMLSNIFVCLFPYKNDSIYMLGYKKKNEKKLKPYINSIIKNKEKFIERVITNQILFNCETWVCSENLFKEKIKNNEKIFEDAIMFSNSNYNERKLWDINIFNSNFHKDFEREKSKYIK